MDAGFNAAQKEGPPTSHRQLWRNLSTVLNLCENHEVLLFFQDCHTCVLYSSWSKGRRWQIHMQLSSVFQAVRLPHAHMINGRWGRQRIWNLSPPLESFHLLSRFVSFCLSLGQFFLSLRWICSLLCRVHRRSVPRMPSTESRTEDNPYDYRHLLRKTSQRRKLIKQYWTLRRLRWNLSRSEAWYTLRGNVSCYVLYEDSSQLLQKHSKLVLEMKTAFITSPQSK